MTSGGLWYGLNKYLDWTVRGTGYHWICRLDVGYAESVDVYAGWDYWSDLVGTSTCNGIAQFGAIKWYPIQAR
jgi:hypothetical protein